MKEVMKKKLEEAIVVGVDMDGTLCLEECWTREQCRDASPNVEMIRKINELSKTKFIVIYTARRDNLITSTLVWLRKWRVGFNAISNNKMPADFYIDDKAVGVEEFLEE